MSQDSGQLDLVTVYIPTKNRLELLKRAVQSVKDQTYPHIEIIVVDDGSIDETPQYLALEMAAGRLTAIFHKESLGACVARNNAIIRARGSFVTGLDDDDYFISSKRIEYFVDAWRGCGQNIAGLFDSVVVKMTSGQLVRHEMSEVTHGNLRENNVLGSQIFAPRLNYIDAGSFDPAMPAWQDWDLWLRMSDKFGGFKNIHQYSYMVDEIHDANRITTGGEEKIRRAMQMLSEKIENLSLREKSSLTVSLLAYPQVKPRPNEVLTLLMALRLKSFLRGARKLLS